MRGDWIVTIAVIVIAIVVYAVSWRAARARGERRRLDRALAAKARDVMSTPPVVVGERTPVEEAAGRMLARGIGCVPVVDDAGGLVGIVTESDLSGSRIVFETRRPAVAPAGRGDAIEHVYQDARMRPVGEVMTRRVVTATEDEPASDLAVRMIEHRIHRVPVVSEGRVVGIVSRHDLLRLIADEAPGQQTIPPG